MTGIPLDDAQMLAWGSSTGNYSAVATQHITQTRWNTYTLVVFRDQAGDLYGFEWEEGSTEYQDAEHEDPTPVFPVAPFLVTEYRKVS